MTRCVKHSLCLALLLLTAAAFSQSKKELEKKKQKIQNEIDMTNQLLNETQKDKKVSMNQLSTLNKKISLREELIHTINIEVAIIDNQILENSQLVKKLSDEIEKLKKEYAQMIIYAYKNQSAYAKMMFLFSAHDFNQAYRRLKYYQQYAQHRQQQALLITKTQKNLSEKINELLQKKQQKQSLLGNKQQERDMLATEKTEKEVLVKELGSKESQLRADLKKKQHDAEKLQSAIQRIIAEEIRKAREAAEIEAKKKAEALKKEKELAKKKKIEAKEKTTAKTAPKTETKEKSSISESLNLSSEAQLLSDNFESNKNKLPWPVSDGVITGYFGEHDHPVLKGVKMKNNGIDISTRNGAQVRSVFDGEVTGVISIPGAGKAIIVRHGEYLTVYSNLADTYVQKGDKLSTRQNIGLAQSDEDSKTEVHFEIWKGSTLLNPIGWIYKSN